MFQITTTTSCASWIFPGHPPSAIQVLNKTKRTDNGPEKMAEPQAYHYASSPIPMYTGCRPHDASEHEIHLKMSELLMRHRPPSYLRASSLQFWCFRALQISFIVGSFRSLSRRLGGNERTKHFRLDKETNLQRLRVWKAGCAMQIMQ